MAERPRTERGTSDFVDALIVGTPPANLHRPKRSLSGGICHAEVTSRAPEVPPPRSRGHFAQQSRCRVAKITLYFAAEKPFGGGQVPVIVLSYMWALKKPQVDGVSMSADAPKGSRWMQNERPTWPRMGHCIFTGFSPSKRRGILASCKGGLLVRWPAPGGSSASGSHTYKCRRFVR